MKNTLLALLLVLPASALAQEVQASAEASASAEAAPASSGGSILVAPKVGFFKTTTPLQGAFYAGAEVGYVTPVLDRKLAVVLEGSWHQPRVNGTVTDPQLTWNSTAADGSYTLVEREISILLTAVYRAEGMFGAVTPYGGAGPGFYVHQATITSFGSKYVEDQNTFGFQLLAGGEYAVGPGAGFLEAHYHFTNIDFLSTGKVNVGGFLAASIGYRFRF